MEKFKKINSWLHLWLGVISGIIVINICLTGCIWMFNDEIDGLLKRETVIKQQHAPILTPSQVKAIGLKEYPGMKMDYIIFRKGKAINANLSDSEKTTAVLYLNPYTGNVVRKEIHATGETGFFQFILNGHRFLWLPADIGRPIVNYATLTFVIILITGLIWWWPKKWNKSTRQRIFKVKWKGSFKRINYDLHNVFGFYALLILLCIALTGMVWGLKWYNEGLYWVTSGGKVLPPYKDLQSDSTQVNKFYTADKALDKAFATVIEKHPQSNGFFFSFPGPEKIKAIIELTVYPNNGQFYNYKSYKFDQHTLRQLKDEEVYESAFETAPFATKLQRMNYDLHVGSIFGLPGKLLVFCCTLIGASLPVTGFIMWYNRKFGKKKSRRKDDEETRKKYQLLKQRQIRKNKNTAYPPIVPKAIAKK